jgi:alcohol dehydrogenase class IV
MTMTQQHLTTFTFENPGKLIVEWGGAACLGERLAYPFAGLRRLLVVTDKALRDTHIADPALASLSAAGFEVQVFDAVVADPPEGVLRACVDLGRDFGAQGVIGFGGGSSMDVAKLAALLLQTDQPLDGLYGIDKAKGDRLPLVQIPTTAGTGSEVTNITILTTGGTTKMGVVSRQLYADLVLLDAALTVGLPRIHTAATGIDAMVHAIEAYTSRLRKNPLSDLFAREALRLLSAHLVAACEDGANRTAREAMLLGACYAGQAFSNSPVAAVHALAYPLGGHFHLPHGLTNALMLGPVLRFNMRAAAPLYAELADAIVGAAHAEMMTRAAAFVDHIQDLMNRSGAPRRLRDVGVTEDSLPLLAADAMKQTRLLTNNPVEVTEADALRLYQEAF